MTITWQEYIFRLFLAALLGGIVGFERETEKKPAGLRTHILVCVGSCLVMLVSIYIYYSVPLSPNQRADPSRIAAQVVTGIGFLGAGTIIRAGATVKGLTTAASIWIVSGIGLAVGCGFYGGALSTAGIVILVLIFLERIEKVMKKKIKFKVLEIYSEDKIGQLGKMARVMSDFMVDIKNVSLKNEEGGKGIVELTVNIPEDISCDMIKEELKKCEGVINVEWKN